MTRPKKNINQVRLKALPRIRCTEIELEVINRRAKEAGMTQAGYVREIAISGSVMLKQSRADAELTFQLMKIGTNINQMTRAVHAKEFLPIEELLNTLSQLNSVLDELISE